MKAKKFMAMGTALVLALSMTACSGGGNQPKETAQPKESPAAEQSQTAGEAPAASEAADKSQRLIIYTNSGSNGRDAWLKERAAKEGYNIEVVHVQAADLANRIISEKNNPQADMIFGLNSIEYEKLKKEGVLEKWEPSWSGDVDMSMGDPEGYYYPIVIQPLVNIMNADLENPPKDYTDLLAPEWKDRYTILNFGGGTGKTILAGLLSRYRDDNGEFGVSEEGWNVVKDWIQNGHIAQEGEDNVGNVISGERPISGIWGSGVIQNQTERGYQFEIMVPEAGVPYVTEQVAMLAGSDKRALAVDFANWFGPAALQTEWMEQFGSIPCQPAALEAAPEDVKEFIGKVHPQDLDWGFISENIEQWVEKCELEFMQ